MHGRRKYSGAACCGMTQYIGAVFACQENPVIELISLAKSPVLQVKYNAGKAIIRFGRGQ
jgi:hypothetical protein